MDRWIWAGSKGFCVSCTIKGVVAGMSIISGVRVGGVVGCPHGYGWMRVS